jgi:hypothetical protein
MHVANVGSSYILTPLFSNTGVIKKMFSYKWGGGTLQGRGDTSKLNITPLGVGYIN